MRITVTDSWGDDLEINTDGTTPNNEVAIYLDYDGDRVFGSNEVDKLIEALQKAKEDL